MSTRAAYGAAWFLVFVTAGVGLYFYSALPEMMVTHWNAEGIADGSVGTFWGVALMPLVMALAITILALVPRIDPMRENIASFRLQYDIFVVLFIAVLAAIQTAVIAVNLGADITIQSVIMPAVGILFFSFGSLLPKTKRNWFIGIRTPWTISSDAVWQRTHRLGGFLFKILGVIAVLSILVPTHAVVLFFVPLAVAIFGLIAYSYVVYRELETRL